MRIQVEFEIQEKNQLLTFNYQYPLSAWIYGIIRKGDKVFSDFLHEKGYTTDQGKNFKLFCFSGLRFPKGLAKKSNKEPAYMLINARKAWLDVSFYLPEQLEPFVAGLFKQQEAFIGDKKHVVKMQVKNVEMRKEPEFDADETYTCKTKTAVVLGENTDGAKHEQYIIPVSPTYSGLMKNSMIDKCKSVGMKNVKADDINFEVQKVKTKPVLQRIKAGTEQETKVKGFYYEFNLQAPTEVMKLLYSTGIGSMNSLGFGMWEVKK
jgi:CRISPR-associated endoribonuclease Cas6